MRKTIVPGVGTIKMTYISKGIDANGRKGERPHGPMKPRMTRFLQESMDTFNTKDDNSKSGGKTGPGVIESYMKKTSLICEFKEKEGE